MKKETVTINSGKFDHSIHRTWQAELLDETPEYFFLKGIFADAVKHSKLGLIEKSTVSYEYYPKTEWFNIFYFFRPDGSFRNFYCNINLPPVKKNSVIDYIDMDLDILVNPDFSFEVLDMDEFEQNSLRYNYPQDIKSKCTETLSELQSRLDRREFPFRDFMNLITKD